MTLKTLTKIDKDVLLIALNFASLTDLDDLKKLYREELCKPNNTPDGIDYYTMILDTVANIAILKYSNELAARYGITVLD